METGVNGQTSQIAQNHVELGRKKENENVTILLQKERGRIVLVFLMLDANQRIAIPILVLVSILPILHFDH